MSAPDHLSALALDELAHGVLAGAAHDAAQAHLATCPRCRADAATADAARAEFQRAGYARTVEGATSSPRRLPGWMWRAVPAVMLAATVVAVLVAWPREGAPAEPDLTIKGGPTLRVFANHAGDVFPVRDGTRLVAGDRIRFVIEPAGAPYVMVASIDGLGAATIYYPFGGDESARLAAGARHELPGSIVLDAATGPERVYAIFSDEPLAANTVLARLRRVGARGAAAIWTEHELDLSSGARSQRSQLSQLSIVFDKGMP